MFFFRSLLRLIAKWEIKSFLFRRTDCSILEINAGMKTFGECLKFFESSPCTPQDWLKWTLKRFRKNKVFREESLFNATIFIVFVICRGFESAIIQNICAMVSSSISAQSLTNPDQIFNVLEEALHKRRLSKKRRRKKNVDPTFPFKERVVAKS